MDISPSAEMSLAEWQIDTLPLGICVVDGDLNIYSWNRTLTRWTGIPADTAIGSNLFAHFGHLRSPRFLHRINGAFESCQPALFAPSSVHPFIPVPLVEGDPDNLMLQKVLIEAIGDQKQYAQITLTDVTAQYRQIQQLRAEKEQHRLTQGRANAILETAADPIITISGLGLIKSFNPAAERLFGYSETDVLEQNVNMLIPSPSRNKHDVYWARYLKTEKRKNVGAGTEAIGRRKNGATFPIHLSVSEVVFGDVRNSLDKDDREDTLFTGIIRDLTQQTQAQADLTAAKEIAEAANRAKSEFLANMSHEIRTPMTAILGFTDILIGNVAEPENVEAAHTIKRNGECLIGLINDILDLSKIESGKCEIEPLDVSPHEIVSDVATLMSVRAKAKGLPLVVRFDGPIPETICTDPTRLRQILINVVGNAIKFTETGSVQIVIRLLNKTSDKPKLQVDVIDTGIGIADDKIEGLFSSFTQADSSTTRKFGGTGLGLSISKRLVELLGGELSVSSTIRQGSTFSITVSTGPLKDRRLIHHTQQAVVKTVPAQAGDETQTSLRHCRILLAEDGPDNQRLIGFILKKAGADVTLADNGQIAFDLATAARTENRPFDVILMDMQMPVLDGYEATRRLRYDGYSFPIIALTAHAMSGDRQQCLDAGCDDYVTKPIDRKKLTEIVASHAKQATDAVTAAGSVQEAVHTTS